MNFVTNHSPPPHDFEQADIDSKLHEYRDWQLDPFPPHTPHGSVFLLLPTRRSQPTFCNRNPRSSINITFPVTRSLNVSFSSSRSHRLLLTRPCRISREKLTRTNTPSDPSVISVTTPVVPPFGRNLYPLPFGRVIIGSRLPVAFNSWPSRK